MPAAGLLVLAVGGTTLTASHQTGHYVSETAMSDPAASRGSGGGFRQPRDLPHRPRLRLPLGLP